MQRPGDITAQTARLLENAKAQRQIKTNFQFPSEYFCNYATRFYSIEKYYILIDF